MKTAKLKVGTRVTLRGVEYTVVNTDAFGSTPHYGVTFQSVRGEMLGQYHSGWVPTDLLDDLVQKYRFTYGTEHLVLLYCEDADAFAHACQMADESGQRVLCEKWNEEQQSWDFYSPEEETWAAQ